MQDNTASTRIIQRLFRNNRSNNTQTDETEDNSGKYKEDTRSPLGMSFLISYLMFFFLPPPVACPSFYFPLPSYRFLFEYSVLFFYVRVLQELFVCLIKG